MAVYVDNFEARFGRMLMCHMRANTFEELHKMADKIGVNRKWFQSDSRYPHYDICKSKKALAIKFGAKEIPMREMPKIKTI